LIAVALRALARSPERLRDDEPIAVTALRQHVLTLSRLFKYEFMFRADADFDAIFDDRLAAMIEQGLVSRDGDDLSLAPEDAPAPGDSGLRFHAAIVQNFLEAYRIAARGLQVLHKGELSRKELLKKLLRRGERMFLEGAIERSEAVSRPLLDNAISAFKDQGYLTLQKDHFSLTATFQGEAARAGIESSIAAYLPTTVD
jgi:glycerol-3-phosphate O-acyltransferase